MWITPAYILQSSLYVSGYLYVIHLLHCAAPLRVIFWFLFSKRVKAKQLRRQKRNRCQAAALNETWRLLHFFEAACVKVVMNQIFIFRIRILSADTAEVKAFRVQCKILVLHWKNWTLLLRFFSQNNCFIFNWMLGCRRSGNQHSFSDTKTIKHVMWPFYVSKNCLWDLIHLSVCLPTFLCHQPQLLNDWNAVKQSSIYNHFIR